MKFGPAQGGSCHAHRLAVPQRQVQAQAVQAYGRQRAVPVDQAQRCEGLALSLQLTKAGETKESVFAIGDYAHAPAGETEEQGKARRDGRRFAMAEAHWSSRASIPPTTASSTASSANRTTRLSGDEAPKFKKQQGTQ